MENTNKDKGQVSPRFVELTDKLGEWLDQYPDFKDDDGIDLIILGHDEKYNGRIVYTLTNEKTPVHSIFRAYNHGLGKISDDTERDIFNGICDWYCQVFAEHPELYKKFTDGVDYYRNKLKEEKK
jgi:hypothetical protein